MYLGYTPPKSQNSIIKRNKQNMWMDTSPKKIYRWQRSTWKDVQPLVTRTKQPKTSVTNQCTPTRKLTVKSLTRPTVGEDAEQMKLAYTAVTISESSVAVS